jgi:hypothetical protein
MKTWALMYGIIWVAFFEIIIILFPFAGQWPTNLLHAGLGAVLLALAYLISKQVKETACPARVKRIAKATLSMSIFQSALGILLFALLVSNIGGLVLGFLQFLHVGVALTIITQASSSATAYDMWEEKEFA